MSNGKKSSTIYFVRHGECKANVEHMNLPPEIDVITDKGILQASMLGKELQDVTFTHAYVSTYSRALDTANSILKELKTPKPELKEDSRIREREMGEFENQSMFRLFDALFAAAREQGTKLLDFEVSGGEPVQNMEERISSFLEELLTLIRENDEPKNILVVSHGVLIIRMMLKLRFWSKDTSRAFTLNGFSLQQISIPIKNTAYHMLTVSAPPANKKNANIVIDFTKVQECGHLDALKPKVPAPPNKEFVGIVETWKEITTQQCATV